MDVEEFFEKYIKENMYNDIECMLRCGLNFSLAMVLAAYTEIVGSVYNANIGLPGKGECNYHKMLELMGYPQIKDVFKCEFRTIIDDEKERSPYKIIRCGLIHQFITKQKACIDVDFPDSTKGIEIRNGIIYISNKKYFEEFKIAIDKISIEMKDNPDKRQKMNGQYNSNCTTMYSGPGQIIHQSK